MARYLTWIACALAGIGCAEEALSLGDLRCAGDGVTCEPVPVTDSLIPDLPGPELLAERETEIAWSAELACPDGDACSAQETALLLHADGSITIAQALVVLPEDPSRDPLSHEVWIGRFDAAGTLIAEDNSLIGRLQQRGNYEVELARTADDRALLGVLRERGELVEVSIYDVGEDAELEHLFDVSDLLELSGIAALDDDVLIAGPHWSGSYDDGPTPELARYDRSGELIWRQTGLRHLSGGLSPSDVGLVLALDMPLTTLEDGGTFIAVLESVSSSDSTLTLQEIGADGNALWSSFPFGAELLPGPKLAVNSRRDVVRGHGAYQIAEHIRDAQGSEHPSLRLVDRYREEYWDTSLLGLDYDSEDRVLVATQEGPREEPRLLIDRYEADFARRESFAVQGASALLGGIAGENSSFLEVKGLEVGHEDELYVWTPSHVARIDLP